MNTRDRKYILFTEASLVDSSIYQSFNRNSEFNRTILKAIKSSTVVTKDYIEEQLMQIRRTKLTPLADEVIEAYNKGNIVLLYSSEAKIPLALPFFASRMRGQIRVFIFINNYASIKKSETDAMDKFLTINMKDLYVLMEGAYISYKYAINPMKVTRNLGLMRLSCVLYTQMLLRILNKEYAISMDLDLYIQVSFAISKFFLENVWMSTNDNINTNYARSIITSQFDTSSITQINSLYDEANIKTIDQLIAFLHSLAPRLKPLNFRYFLQCYINTYKPGAMFSLECLPYFLYVIEASLCGSFLINQPIISDICKNTKGINTFSAELTKSIG